MFDNAGDNLENIQKNNPVTMAFSVGRSHCFYQFIRFHDRSYC